MSRLGQGLVLALILSVTVTAIAVVIAKHQSRQRFIELQQLRAERDALQVDWGRLQLEQSTWSTHGRIELRARRDLHLALPDNQDIVFIKP